MSSMMVKKGGALDMWGGWVGDCEGEGGASPELPGRRAEECLMSVIMCEPAYC